MIPCRCLPIAVIAPVLLAGVSWAAGPQDWVARYSVMRITEIDIAGTTMSPEFWRHELRAVAGFGPYTAGVELRRTDKGEDTAAGEPESGVMLTGGWNLLLRDGVRLDTRARVGVSPDNDPSQPLYGTDTDLAANLVAYSTEGAGWIGSRPVHPSGYVGAIVNRYGRVQGVAAGGLWWNGLGAYVTGLYAFNGTANPLEPGDDADHAFASLRNRMVTLSLGWDIAALRLEVARNLAIENAGNDLVLGVQYRGWFGSGMPR